MASQYIFCAECGAAFDSVLALRIHDERFFGDGTPAGDFELSVCSTTCFGEVARARLERFNAGYVPEDDPLDAPATGEKT